MLHHATAEEFDAAIEHYTRTRSKLVRVGARFVLAARNIIQNGPWVVSMHKGLGKPGLTSRAWAECLLADPRYQKILG